MRHTWPFSSILVPVRQASNSDSDSDYGARAHKKKKKSRPSADEVRVSSRGVKVPNYVDDVHDFEKFEEHEPDDNGYYVDPNQQYQEEDEIEAVLGHSREEGREDDPEDLWFENLVRCFTIFSISPYSKNPCSAFISSGKTFRISTTRTRPTNSSNALGGSSVSTTTSKLIRSGSLACKHQDSPRKILRLFI